MFPNPNQKIVVVPLESCQKEISQEKPILTVANADEKRGAVSLSWTPIAGASEYWLEFGSEENSEQFRHRGITATNYTVLNLDMKNDLFFRVLPIADCAHGQFSHSIQVAGKEGKKAIVSKPSEESQVLGSQDRDAKGVAQEGELFTDYVTDAIFIPLQVFIVLLSLFWLLFRRRVKS